MVDFRIFPTENDVGNATGEGRWATEENLVRHFGSITGTDQGINQWVSGLNPTGTGTGNLVIDPGACVVGGQYVELVNQKVIDISSESNNTLNYWIQIQQVSNLTTGAIITSLTTGSNLADAFFLGSVSLTGTVPNRTISTIRDGRLGPPMRREFGEYVGNGANGRNIGTTFKPSYVMIRAPGLESVSGLPAIPGSVNPIQSSVDTTGENGFGRLTVDFLRWENEIGLAESAKHHDQITWWENTTSVDFSGTTVAQSAEITKFWDLSSDPPVTNKWCHGLVRIQNFNPKVQIFSAIIGLREDGGSGTWAGMIKVGNLFGWAQNEPITTAAGTISIAVRAEKDIFPVRDIILDTGTDQTQYAPELSSTGFVVSFNNVSGANNFSTNHSGVIYRYYAIG